MFEWDDFRGLAEELATRSGDEAAQRTAISRAYYACFHAGRGYLAEAGIAVDAGGGAHRQVRNELRSRSADAGEQLWRLHLLRKEADYDNPCSFDINEGAADAVLIARTLVARI